MKARGRSSVLILNADGAWPDWVRKLTFVWAAFTVVCAFMSSEGLWECLLLT